ncbi:AMP-binding protein [Cystobacter fuscus]|uniref:AMP-binding protein n=1 Tax=Cystobacter fuscus TaxID=43 RepID=UPI002B319C82|nr:AMP-binding protein [Cystobacter fuscus]
MNLGLLPAKWAALTPRRTALVDITHQRRIDWATLDSRVRRLANGLRALGLRSGDRVAVLSRNSIEYQELYFAVGRAGLVLQPLNWRLSTEALRTLVAEAEPAVLVASAEFRHVAGELGRAVDLVRLLYCGLNGDGGYEELIASAPDTEPPWSEQVQEDDPCFILYTGGTTGMAKGVVHTHRSVTAGMLNQTVAERIVPSDVYMLTGQMFHIPVVLSMNYLAHGCPVVLMNFDARQALEVIEQERVSAFLGITTMLNWMLAVPGFGNYDLSSLRNIQYGGGPMPSAIVRAVAESFPCGLIQGYGQTEGVTMSFLSQEDHRDALRGVHPHRLRSCGREGFGTRIRVVDADGHDVPRDRKTPGEIVVRGAANMLGYFRRPDLTAATFRDGWMRTGDVATWDDERYLYIVDRLKDMIISGGEKIYSVEVEEAIGRHPAVLECAVIGVPDEQWGESVKAFVVLKPDQTATAEDIIDVARRHLASYQKPRSVEFVARLPKAPTGKLLKRELRAPYWADRDIS